MLLMLEMRTNTRIVFFHVGERKLAEQFRRAHPEFRGRKITAVIQAMPSFIPMGVPMTIGAPHDLKGGR
jgi:hypothetical protein